MTEEYDLAKSSKGLGKLYPILKDVHGNIIDGFHRQNADPDWPTIVVESVDSDVKLELARLGSNFCRRTLKEAEMRRGITFLVKKGIKPDDIADQTGIGKTTIYKYMPQELKDGKQVEIAKQGGVASSVSREVSSQANSTVKTSDMTPVVMVECERCHTATSEPKDWNGHQLCETHYKHALENPDFYKKFFGYLDKKLPQSKPTEPKRQLESWTDRQAKMHPNHSKMEERVLSLLVDKGIHNIVQDRHFCVKETVPDFYFPDKNLAVYLDFEETHKNRQDKDEQLREWLTKCHGIRVQSLPYDTVSQKETDRLVKAILEEVSS
jgi:very-short-patch-repair endonuclease